MKKVRNQVNSQAQLQHTSRDLKDKGRDKDQKDAKTALNYVDYDHDWLTKLKDHRMKSPQHDKRHKTASLGT